MVVTGLFRHACKTVCVVLVGALLGTGIAYGDEAKQAETEPFAVFHNAYYAYMKFGDYPAALRLSSEWIAAINSRYGNVSHLSERELIARFPMATGTGYTLLTELHDAVDAQIDVLYLMRDFRSASRLLELDLTLGRLKFGQYSPRYVDELAKFTLMAKATGNFEMAVTWTEMRVASLDRMLGKASLPKAGAMVDLAILHADLGQPEKARAVAETALDIFRFFDVAGGAGFRQALSVLARAEQKLGNLAAAENHLLQILDDMAAHGQTNLPEFGVYLGQAARIVQAQGDDDRAVALLEAAIENALMYFPKDRQLAAFRMRRLGDHYRDAGKTELAGISYRHSESWLYANAENYTLQDFRSFKELALNHIRDTSADTRAPAAGQVTNPGRKFDLYIEP